MVDGKNENKLGGWALPPGTVLLWGIVGCGVVFSIIVEALRLYKG